jgi:copper oxidase (laccase) domain-containing protein
MNYEIFISNKPICGKQIRKLEGLPVLTAVPVGEAQIVFFTTLEINRKADAIVTDKADHWMGTLTADELTVFIVGKEAAGVVYANWKNILKGTIFKTVRYIEQFSRVCSAILGISICKDCYLVDEEVYSKFPDKYKGCFRQSPCKKYFFDLKKAATIQLSIAGVENVGVLNGCTICNNYIYHSYTKEKTDKKILSAIRILRNEDK